MTIKAKTFTGGGGGAGTDTLDDVTGRGATTTNAITVGGLSVGTAYTMPTSDGSTGEFLKTDGSGNISFGGVTGGLTYKGSYNATTSTPSLVTALKGDFYIVSVAGSLAGVSLAVGDHIVFNQDASNPVTSAMFDVIDNTEADTLDSVTTRGSTTSNTVGVGGLTINSAITFPTADGGANQFIKTNGSGTLSFDTALTALVDDATPELASDLDTVGNGITSSLGGFSLTTSGGSDITIGADLVPITNEANSLGSEDKRYITTFSDLNGAVRFKAKNDSGGTINKGQAVYITGISGDVPTVDLARANSAATMPAFGLAATSANDQAEVQVVSFGNLTSYDTTTYSLSIGDTVYVSSSTAGALTNTAPTGEANLIQNIGKVVRASATEGVIKVGGAGRSAATPNLDQDKIFLGNASNQAVSTALSSIALSSFNNDLSFQPLDAGLTSISGLTTAADKMIYTTASDTYAVTDLTTAGRALLDDADASAQRTTLGLGTAATSASTDFLASTAGLNDLSDVSFTAGAGIDNYVLTYDHSTTSWGAEAAAGGGAPEPTITIRSSTSYTLTAANAPGISIWYGVNNTDTFTVTMPNISDVISTAAAANGNPAGTFEVYIGRGRAGNITVSAADGIDLIGDGTITYSTTQTVDSGQWIKLVGWYVSSSTQRYLMDSAAQPRDAGLTSISELTTAADKMIYTTASDTYAVTDLTSAGRALLDDADASAQRTTLGLGTAATSASTDFLASTAGLNDLSDVSFTAGAGIDNYVLTYDHSTTSWGAEAAAGGGWTYSAITADPANAQVGYHYSCTSGSFTITLPAASGTSSGSEIRVKNMGSGTITIDPGTDTIDGSTTDYTLDVQYSAITLVSNGSNGWEII
jgi:hypothetical protein